MFDNLKKNKSGFTLIELILYIALATALLLAISGFFGLVLGARVKSQTIAEVEQQGLQIMQIITQTTRNATAINNPAAGSSAASLSLNVVTPSQSPTVFDLSSGVVRIKQGTSATVNLNSGQVIVSALSFQNLTISGTKGIVKIQFTMTRLNLSGSNELDYTKTFYASAALR